MKVAITRTFPVIAKELTVDKAIVNAVETLDDEHFAWFKLSSAVELFIF